MRIVRIGGGAHDGCGLAGAGQGRHAIAGDDPQAIVVASSLIRDFGYEPVLIGGLVMGRRLNR